MRFIMSAFNFKIKGNLFNLRIYNRAIQKDINKFFRSRYGVVDFKKERGVWKPTINTTYYVEKNYGFEYDLHISQLEPFLEFLKSHPIVGHNIERILQQCDVEIQTVKEHPTVTIEHKEKYKLREEQEKISSLIMRKVTPPPSFHNASNLLRLEKEVERYKERTTLVGLRTGGGKTLTTCVTSARLKTKHAVVIRPSFLKKWVNDHHDYFDYDDPNRDFYVVEDSSKALLKLCELATSGKAKAKHYLFSNKLMQIFIKTYREDRAYCLQQYGCTPLQLFDLLGIDLLIVDEAHLDFHLNYMLYMYTSAYRTVSLTGSLVNKNPFYVKLYQDIFPYKTRYVDSNERPYLKSYSVIYNIYSPEKIATTNRGDTKYSHTAFEESIMRHYPTFRDYKTLIKECLQMFYMKEYINGDKALIYFARIDMCSDIVEFLAKEFPNKKVYRYVSGDDYVTMLNSDIIVTTVGKLGAAIDIANLRTVIHTVPLDSAQQAYQNAGRLRELKDRDVKYISVFCEDIDKHIKYTREKLQLLQRRLLFNKQIVSGICLGRPKI